MKRSNVAVRAQRNQPPSLSRDTWVGTLVSTHCEANGEWEALHALRFGQRHHSAARLVAESRGGLWNFGTSLQVKTQASDSHQPLIPMEPFFTEQQLCQFGKANQASLANCELHAPPPPVTILTLCCSCTSPLLDLRTQLQ